jgi:hypothetical protein
MNQWFQQVNETYPQQELVEKNGKIKDEIMALYSLLVSELTIPWNNLLKFLPNQKNILYL